MEGFEKDSPFIPSPNLIYKIIPEFAPDLAFEIKDGKKEDGTNVQLGNLREVPYQYFKIVQIDDSKKCYFEPLHCKDSVIDVCKAYMHIRTNIQLYHKNQTNAQQFYIVKVSKNTYNILSSKDKNFCLDIHARSNKSGANVQLFKRNYTIAQSFKIIGKRNHFAAIEYALKYATERNPDFQECDPNGANFCSQCLLAGGYEPDEKWNKDDETFTDATKLRLYFYEKGIEWTEYPNISDFHPGDIAYMYNKDNQFDRPVFVIRKDCSQIIFCANSMDIKEGSLNYNLIAAVLKTSSLFK